MRHRIVAVVLFAVVSAAPLLADKRMDAKAQVEFGWSVAEKGLWKEATYRWLKAVEVDPTYAEAWNDLGVAYEQSGQLEEAKKAYEKAIKLEPANQLIRQNYDMFREIYDRTHRHGDL